MLHISTSCIFLINSTFFINFRIQDIFNTQSSAKVMSKNGVLFFGLVNNSAIGCWNEHQPLQRQNMVSNFLIFLGVFLAHFFQLLLFIIFSYEKNTYHCPNNLTSHVIQCNKIFIKFLSFKIFINIREERHIDNTQSNNRIYIIYVF